jgi:myosin heavy chain 9/10/11/14
MLTFSADVVKELEESRKKLNKDIEALMRQIEELQAANDRLDKSKKKIQSELEDATIELELQRTKVLELEKKQKNFDKVLAEEKAISEQNAQERDAAEREAREKETKVLSLTRELDEQYEKNDDLETKRKALQNELDELANTQVSCEVEGCQNLVLFYNHLREPPIKTYTNWKKPSVP